MVSVDIYLNETTRHADVILPGPLPLEDSHFDVLSPSSRCVTPRATAPARRCRATGPAEWQTMLRLIGICATPPRPTDVDVAAAGRRRAAAQARRGTRSRCSRGRDGRGPSALLDLMLRAGPYGLTLDRAEAAPHGIDLGPLRRACPAAAHAVGQIELAPAPLIAVDVARRARDLARPAADLVLIGRRQLRSNNSWMHNLPPWRAAGSGAPR